MVHGVFYPRYKTMMRWDLPRNKTKVHIIWETVRNSDCEAVDPYGDWKLVKINKKIVFTI